MMKKLPTHTPIKIRVSSGGSAATVEARSFVEAFGLFLDKKLPKALGKICKFKTKELDPVDDTWYMDTVRLLKEVGRYSEK